MRRTALGKVRRTGAPPLEPLEAVLDDPVLERMKCDHTNPAAVAQRPHGRLEKSFELAQLVVDRNPQGLEDAGGWMNTPAVCKFSRNGSFNNLG